MTGTATVTLSGRDSGGFVFQNVFHVKYDTSETHEKTILSALAEAVIDAVMTPYLAAMSSACSVYDVATKLIGGVASYTFHSPVNYSGTREETAYPGPVSGKIAFYPESGANVGHIYPAGTCEGDYEDDVLSDAYKTKLQAIADALLTLDGSNVTYAWQLVIYNRKLATAVAVAAGTALLTACYLSKRARA